ncbi:hypothetical protein BV898_17759 [Hypsibius exemplaris]|uniref:Uncharacterized protein n=1 Tax=Hypsibius exemplaris TaxID=2072580 RepID=A0A9X6NFN7_HYPEX|nr:hypothetical protein BV898_17759 [Hypsibius exemplaris]
MAPKSPVKTLAKSPAKVPAQPPDTELIKLIQGALRASRDKRLIISGIVGNIVEKDKTRDKTGFDKTVDKTMRDNEGAYFRRPDGHPNMWEEQDIEGLRALSTQLLQENRRLNEDILTKQDIEGTRTDYTQLLQENQRLKEKNQQLDADILAGGMGALQVGANPVEPE